MKPRGVNCWEDRRCGREPGGTRAEELGVCPAATDATGEGVNRGRRGGRTCWTVEGTRCGQEGGNLTREQAAACEQCAFFRRVKYEEGCAFQLLRPIFASDGTEDLHRTVNHLVSLLGLYRDAFTRPAPRPFLERAVCHLFRITEASAIAAYLASAHRPELALQAAAGDPPRPDGIPCAVRSPAAEAFRLRRLCRGRESVFGRRTPAEVLAVPISGVERPVGAIEAVFVGVRPTPRDEWFVREFGVACGLALTCSVAAARPQAGGRAAARHAEALAEAAR